MRVIGPYRLAALRMMLAMCLSSSVYDCRAICVMSLQTAAGVPICHPGFTSFFNDSRWRM